MVVKAYSLDPRASKENVSLIKCLDDVKEKGSKLAFMCSRSMGSKDNILLNVCLDKNKHAYCNPYAQWLNGRLFTLMKTKRLRLCAVEPWHTKGD